MEILPRAKLLRQTPQSELHEVAVDLAEDAQQLLEEEEVVDHQDQRLQNLHDQWVAHLQALQDREYHQDHDHHDQQDTLRTLHEEGDLDPGLSQEVREAIVGIVEGELEEGDSHTLKMVYTRLALTTPIYSHLQYIKRVRTDSFYILEKLLSYWHSSIRRSAVWSLIPY
jgi:hypothetical protein